MKVGTGEVGTPTVAIPPARATFDRRARQLAGLPQQGADRLPATRHVRGQQGIGGLPCQRLHPVERCPQLRMHRSCSLQRQCLGQVPGQLVELPHDREDVEHALRRAGRLPPVHAWQRCLGDVLSGAEAVEGHAPGHALLPQPVVDPAAGIRSQVPARDPGRLVEREVRGGREDLGDAAQTQAAAAVRAQLETAIGRCTLVRQTDHAPRFAVPSSPVERRPTRARR